MHKWCNFLKKNSELLCPNFPLINLVFPDFSSSDQNFFVKIVSNYLEIKILCWNFICSARNNFWNFLPKNFNYQAKWKAIFKNGCSFEGNCRLFLRTLLITLCDSHSNIFTGYNLNIIQKCLADTIYRSLALYNCYLAKNRCNQNKILSLSLLTYHLKLIRRILKKTFILF